MLLINYVVDMYINDMYIFNFGILVFIVYRNKASLPYVKTQKEKKSLTNIPEANLQELKKYCLQVKCHSLISI